MEAFGMKPEKIRRALASRERMFKKMDREREPAEIKKRNVKTISDEALPKLFQQVDEFAKEYSEIRVWALKFGLIAAPARQSRKRKVAAE